MISPTRIAEITALAEAASYTAEHGIFDAVKAGKHADPTEIATALTELLAEREAMVARMAVLEGALEPFAEKAAYADALEMEDTDYCECAPILAGQYRAARAALKEQS